MERKSAIGSFRRKSQLCEHVRQCLHHTGLAKIKSLRPPLPRTLRTLRHRPIPRRGVGERREHPSLNVGHVNCLVDHVRPPPTARRHGVARDKTVGRQALQMKPHRGDMQTEQSSELAGRHSGTRVTHRRQHALRAGTCVLTEPHD